jgi:hypothetical protein
MQLFELIGILNRYQVFSDFFRVCDVKDPFLECKLLVLDEMTTGGHKKLFMTDFMEILVRLSVLRYPPMMKSSIEIAKSLQKLLSIHLMHHENVLDEFVETVEHVSLQHRVEQCATQWQQETTSKHQKNLDHSLFTKEILQKVDDKSSTMKVEAHGTVEEKPQQPFDEQQQQQNETEDQVEVEITEIRQVT